MSSRTLVHICLAGLFGLAVLYVMAKWDTQAWQDNPIYPLVSIIGLALVGGVFFVMVILPKLGDAVGTVMYSSGEVAAPDQSMKAAAKIAAGDYEGAIEEYEKVIQEKPEDVHPISEVAKVYSERLNDPQQALAFLQQHLEARDWTEDDAAFLMFRMVDVNSHQKSYNEAKDILEQIVGNFPGTRHSANAKHRINELEQLEFKALQAQRAAQGQGPAA